MSPIKDDPWHRAPDETIDWTQPIAWYDGTPAVINDKLHDDWWHHGLGQDGSAAILLPGHIADIIDPTADHAMDGIVVDHDGTIAYETRIPMPCIRNSSGTMLPPNRAKIKSRQVDREREAMEQNPLWGSF